MEEIWKDIVGYEGKYQISSYGRVKSLYYHNTKGVKRIGFLKSASKFSYKQTEDWINEHKLEYVTINFEKYE